jgi:hypothetical protein
VDLPSQGTHRQRPTASPGAVAQWSEQGTHNPSVAGSIPACPTKGAMPLGPGRGADAWRRPGIVGSPERFLVRVSPRTGDLSCAQVLDSMTQGRQAGSTPDAVHRLEVQHGMVTGEYPSMTGRRGPAPTPHLRVGC